jgi:hypothetical protein
LSSPDAEKEPVFIEENGLPTYSPLSEIVRLRRAITNDHHAFRADVFRNFESSSTDGGLPPGASTV